MVIYQSYQPQSRRSPRYYITMIIRAPSRVFQFQDSQHSFKDCMDYILPGLHWKCFTTPCRRQHHCSLHRCGFSLFNCISSSFFSFYIFWPIRIFISAGRTVAHVASRFWRKKEHYLKDSATYINHENYPSFSSRCNSVDFRSFPFLSGACSITKTFGAFISTLFSPVQDFFFNWWPHIYSNRLYLLLLHLLQSRSQTYWSMIFFNHQLLFLLPLSLGYPYVQALLMLPMQIPLIVS